jgi:hypothetical protein
LFLSLPSSCGEQLNSYALSVRAAGPELVQHRLIVSKDNQRQLWYLPGKPQKKQKQKNKKKGNRSCG